MDRERDRRTDKPIDRVREKNGGGKGITKAQESLKKFCLEGKTSIKT